MTNVKVRVLSAPAEDELEKKVNDVLEVLNINGREIVDIKFTESNFSYPDNDAYWSYSAMIIYKES